jgi:hypothetical protein
MRAHTLVRSDVIALAPQTGIPPNIPETALGDYLLPTPVRMAYMAANMPIWCGFGARIPQRDLTAVEPLVMFWT